MRIRKIYYTKLSCLNDNNVVYKIIKQSVVLLPWSVARVNWTIIGEAATAASFAPTQKYSTYSVLPLSNGFKPTTLNISHYHPCIPLILLHSFSFPLSILTMFYPDSRSPSLYNIHHHPIPHYYIDLHVGIASTFHLLQPSRFRLYERVKLQIG